MWRAERCDVMEGGTNVVGADCCCDISSLIVVLQHLSILCCVALSNGMKHKPLFSNTMELSLQSSCLSVKSSVVLVLCCEISLIQIAFFRQ